jgi:hypothetical protein
MIFYVKPCNSNLSWLQYALHGSVAQGLEQGTHNPLVVGSNPTGPTKKTSSNFALGRIIIKNRYQAAFFIPTQSQNQQSGKKLIIQPSR